MGYNGTQVIISVDVYVLTDYVYLSNSSKN